MLVYCSLALPRTDTMISRYRKILFGFLQGMRKLTKIDDQGVSSLIFTLNTLPVGCVFFAGVVLLFFVGGTLFFATLLGLLILKVLFKPPMPVATGFLELVAVLVFLLLNALQLTSRQDATEEGANADTCTSAISAMATKKIFLLKGGILE